MGNKKLIYPKRDLKGLRFNRLQVIQFIEYYEIKKNRFDIWLCKCDCGNYHKVRGNTLVCKQVQSCGCLLKEHYQKMKIETITRNTKSKGTAAFNHVFNSYKMNAKAKKHEFKLSKEQFTKFIFQNCYYCNRSPQNEYPNPKRKYKRCTNGSIKYNGIDRIINEKGYTLDNIVTACEICNKAKRHLSKEDFELWIKDLTNYYQVRIKSN